MYQSCTRGGQEGGAEKGVDAGGNAGVGCVAFLQKGGGGGVIRGAPQIMFGTDLVYCFEKHPCVSLYDGGDGGDGDSSASE